jgi:phospholipid/cholesterol/gamma-HCH transport system permease protein
MANGPSSSTKSMSWLLRVSPFRQIINLISHVGDVLLLLFETIRRMVGCITTPGMSLGTGQIVTQIVRVGVKSVFIVSLVSGAVGIILAMQLAQPLDDFGQRHEVSRIVGEAVLRELGPLIGAIVLTGFAGAAIAAELGTMKVSEEIEALEAHAINPIRFLVVPRVVATVVSMTVLGVLSNAVAIAGGFGISVTLLDIPGRVYISNLLAQVSVMDFLTGIFKATVFGTLIGLIACRNGLNVEGGAEGVGNATTKTVVECIVAIVIADLLFTAVFYALRWF